MWPEQAYPVFRLFLQHCQDRQAVQAFINGQSPLELTTIAFPIWLFPFPQRSIDAAAHYPKAFSGTSQVHTPFHFLYFSEKQLLNSLVIFANNSRLSFLFSNLNR